jgi:predicted permease
MGTLSSRTCVEPFGELRKPEPKICTPHRSFAGEVSVPCGKIVLGIPLTVEHPEVPGGELGTISSSICAVLMGVVVKTLPKSTMSMVPLPDLTTKA